MPEPFGVHTGLAAALPRDNVDTDQIIPSREMRAVSRDGLGASLFAGWRYRDPVTREPEPDFILNHPAQAGTSIMIAGENFGCGSSREHAVWALTDYGIRAIIAKSFGAIFHGNCLRNGLLPVTLPADDVAALLGEAGGKKLVIDLPRQTVGIVSEPAWARPFEIDAFAKRLLVEGLDPIGLTLKQGDAIDNFLEQDGPARPWLYR
jgi:3-isopropylmalate/(R)-2-methylmalate dehydratase small subunit